MQSKLTYKTENMKLPFGVENSTSVFAFNLLFNFIKMETESYDFSVIEQKKKHIESILSIIKTNSNFAGEIFSDLNSHTQQAVRYHLVNEFHSANEGSTSNRKEIPDELMEIAHCWCCGKELSKCLTLEEEGYTWVHSEADPYIFDRARAIGMTYFDESGHERMHMCGFSYQ